MDDPKLKATAGIVLPCCLIVCNFLKVNINKLNNRCTLGSIICASFYGRIRLIINIKSKQLSCSAWYVFLVSFGSQNVSTKTKDITLKGYTIGHQCIQVQLTDLLSIVIQGHSLFLCLRVNLAFALWLTRSFNPSCDFPLVRSFGACLRYYTWRSCFFFSNNSLFDTIALVIISRSSIFLFPFWLLR